MKIIFPIISNLYKAYTEGIYQDNSLNRKLGRVGMSYKEYEKMIGGYSNQSKNKKEKNEIPVYLSDLKFDKEGKTSYQLKDGTNVEISLISHEKYGDKNFTLKVKNKEFKNLNTTDLLRRLKALKEGTFEQSFENKRISDKIPLTEEEFDKLYGDIGFNYTYYKDNLDIKVWIREDSDKKNPTFNIYVKDTKTGKSKSFTKLSLLQTHNKLLEYDLNPDVEKPLSIQQLKELEKIKKEQNISYEDNNDYLIDGINKYFKKTSKGELKVIANKYSLNGYEFSLNNDSKNEYISISVTKENFPIKRKYIKIKNTKKDLSNFLRELNEGIINLNSENDIMPSKDIGIEFNSYGNAFFNKGDKELKLSISREDNSKIDYIIYNKNEITHVGTLNIDSLNKDTFKEKLGNQVLHSSFYVENQKPIKELLKNKIADKNLLYTLSDITYSDRYKISEQDEKKLENKIKTKGLNYKSSQKRDWNRDIRNTYVFINSRALINWIDDLPNPKEKTKREMYYELKNLSERFSSSGVYRGEFRDVDSISNLKKYIIDKYY